MRLPQRRLVESLQRRMDDGFFGDTAIITQYTETSKDEYGQPENTETLTQVACSFTDKPAKERWTTYADIEEIDAEVRFLGPKPNKGDRITLVNRFDRNVHAGQKYTEQSFEIVDIMDRDVFGYVCALKEAQI